MKDSAWTRSEIDNSVCCFSPGEGGCGLFVEASAGCPAPSQRLDPPVPAAFLSAEPCGAVLWLSSSLAWPCATGRWLEEPPTSPCSHAQLLGTLAWWRHPLVGTVGGFAGGLHAGAGRLQLPSQFIWRPPGCLCWSKLPGQKMCLSAVPCPSFTPVFLKR